MKEQKTTLLRQGNPLTESRYHFSKMEKNVLYKIIQTIRNLYIEREIPEPRFRSYEMMLDAKSLAAAELNDHPGAARDALRKLRDKSIEMTNAQGDWLYCGFINQATYEEKQKAYRIEISGELMPYLVQLTRNYTEYDLTTAMTFRSQYSQRFYELCCQYRNYGGFGKTAQQLKEMFMLEKTASYRRNNLFQTYVIDKAYDEIKAAFDKGQCNLYFTYERTGRAEATHYTFKIHTKDEETKRTANLQNVQDKYESVCALVAEYVKNDKRYIERVREKLKEMPEKIIRLQSKLVELQKDFKKSEMPKMIRYILKTDYDIV